MEEAILFLSLEAQYTNVYMGGVSQSGWGSGVKGWLREYTDHQGVHIVTTGWSLRLLNI